MKAKYLSLLLCIGLFLPLVQPAFASFLHYPFKKESEVPFISFEELQTLSSSDFLTNHLDTKLQKLLRIPFGEQSPHKGNLKRYSDLDKMFFRVAQWNIERGFKLDEIKKIINDSESYIRLDSNAVNYQEGSEKLQDLKSQIKAIQAVDIFLLNEVDYGVARTDYRNVAKELADAIGGGYVYGTEFLEVSSEVLNSPNTDKTRYRGMHGNAIVSKYPIKSSRIVRLPACYDWYSSEQEKITILEQGRRSAAKVTVDETIVTEVRRGGRMALIADIELPNGKRITALSVHLENRTQPKCRVKQMDYLLDEIKHIRNPLVFGGDFNPFEIDASPTSVSKVVKDKVTDWEFMTKTMVSAVNPFALVVNTGLFGLGATHKMRDPTVTNIPVLLPNKSRKLFKNIFRFKFDDGVKFDQSDDPEWSFGKSGNMSTSNERSLKGFVETFELERSYELAKYKVDWLFVKPIMEQKKKRYFPAFGRTLRELNESYKDGKLSDHSPVIADVIL